MVMLLRILLVTFVLSAGMSLAALIVEFLNMLGFEVPNFPGLLNGTAPHILSRLADIALWVALSVAVLRILKSRQEKTHK